MWTAILVTLFAAGVIGAGMLQSRQRLKAWQNAVESCGLEILDTTSATSPHLRAWEGQGALEVRIETFGDKGQSTRIVVEAPGPPDFHRVTIRPQSTFELGREIEIGDGYLDLIFFIQGPEQLVFALLDAKTRRLLGDVHVKSRLEISSGEIRAVLANDAKVAEVLPLLLDLSKRLAPPIEVVRRLAENANQDPERGVRLQNLLLLIRELPNHPETAEALGKACSDAAPEIRLRAAREIGAEGRGVLLELAEGLQDDAVSAEAVSDLERELPFERTTAILDRALSGRHLRTARVCMEAIGRSGAASAVGVLAKVLETKYGELAPVAARALGETGSPAAEPPLIQALHRDQEDLQVAAASALGRVGSVAAVLPLKEMAGRFLLGEIRRAARQAIAEIQSRAQGASPGQLSLAGAETGQLSLTEAEAGQLSLAEDPVGQLSLGDDD
ncbi:MAG TPA: HEAT repeat domain-containing protein [Thermoanaerobaculia bacterium]|jgi:HEAT repeat protein|nr:HEAT repeat domain-containing protein [Thermoanaerobaculia bacterium]